MVSRDVLIATVVNGFATAFQGIQLSQRGPAFIDLLDISGTDLQGGSLYITGANITYMIGSFISGYLYSRVKVTSLTVALAIILAGLSNGATPWCTHFITMLLVISMCSGFASLFETTITTEQMRICHGDSGWAMQFISFCFSLGGIVGPLITEPFLSPKGTANLTGRNMPFNHTQIAPSVYGFHNISGIVNFGNHTSTSNQWPTVGREVSKRLDPDNTKYLIRYAFLITSVLGFMASIPFFVQSFRSRGKENKREECSESTPSSRKLPTKAYLGVVASVSIYYFLFSAFDLAFVQYLSYFVVNYLDWTKKDGALVMAVYWICSTSFKVALILLASHINTGTLLLVNNIGIVTSCVGFTVASQLHIHSMVWVFTALIALSSSGVFGGGMAWADSNLLQMDGKATASIIVSAALGSTVTPIPIGVLMEIWDKISFAYITLGLSCLDILVLIILLFFIKPLIHRIYGPPRPAIKKETSPQEESTDTANGTLLTNTSSLDYNTIGECVTEDAMQQ